MKYSVYASIRDKHLIKDDLTLAEANLIAAHTRSTRPPTWFVTVEDSTGKVVSNL